MPTDSILAADAIVLDVLRFIWKTVITKNYRHICKCTNILAIVSQRPLHAVLNRRSVLLLFQKQAVSVFGLRPRYETRGAIFVCVTLEDLGGC